MNPNREIVDIIPKGGDVLVKEVDHLEVINRTEDERRQASVAVGNLAEEYGDIAAEANRLLAEHGKDPDLALSLSGLSDIMQHAAHNSLELRERSESGTTAEAILRGKTVEELRGDHERSLEGMRDRLKKMEIAAGALDRHDRVGDARKDIDGLETASAIAEEKIFGDGDKQEEEARKEREAAVEAAQRKLDLKAVAKLLSDLKMTFPSIVGQDIAGLNKLLDGDGKETYKATFDITSSISETATRLAARLEVEIENFMDAGVNAQDTKQLIARLRAISEGAKKRANEASHAYRGVSKREIGPLKKRLEQLEDVKLLISPKNAEGTVTRDGRSVDAGKRLAQLRKH